MRTSWRTVVNLLVFTALTAALSIYGFVRWLSGGLFDEPYRLVVPMPEAGGILPAQQVTVRGHAVGRVTDIELTRDGVDLILSIDAGEQVPARAVAQILRRSPIGEQALDLIPVRAGWDPPADVVPARVPVDPDWVAVEPGTRLAPVAAVTPSSVPALLRGAEELLAAVPGDALATVVTELATALRGRSDTLEELNRDAAELGATLVDGLPELDRLIETSGPVLDVLADHREQLAGSFTSLADLSEGLAAQRPTLEAIIDDGTHAMTLTDRLVREERADLSCLLRDTADVVELLAQPQHQEELARLLDLNRYFYGGFDAGTQWDPFRPGVLWARVNILLFEQGGGQPFVPKRATPATLPGAACVSPFGVGVNAVRQTDPPPVPPDPTSPGIDYAPLVEGGDTAGDGGEGGGAAPTTGEERPLPATGVGAPLGPLALALALAASRRPRRGQKG